MAQPIILIEEEPLSNALCKWAGWMAIMVVFLMALIYYSNYFARERFIVDEYHTGHPVQDIKNRKWKHRFDQMDKLTYV